MQNSVKNYWKLGKDQFGDTLWMEKPRKAPNGYWEVCMVHHYGNGAFPGKGSSRMYSCMVDDLVSDTAFQGIVREEIRYKFIELMRAIVISSRYYWMLRRGNSGISNVDGENDVLHKCEPQKARLKEVQRIDRFVIPGLVGLVDDLFK